MFFGDFPGLGHQGSVVLDPAHEYPQLWTSQTLIHAQKRAIDQSPETQCMGIGKIGWCSTPVPTKDGLGGGVQPSKGKLKCRARGGVCHCVNKRKHTEMGWPCGVKGCVVARACFGGHGGGGDWDMVARDGGGGGDHPMESNSLHTSLPSSVINKVNILGTHLMIPI
ncbi:hypothetical protein EDC04DRAFT_2603683 [Pisolithus marmoratus]|nr:hypothetical protein EDC04DRAFT_2603683 [Pisolithus marmoratus]